MRNKVTFFVLLSVLVAFAASSAQANPCEGLLSNRSAIPGVNAGTTLGALFRGTIDRKATGQEFARDALIGTAIGEGFKFIKGKRDKKQCAEALEDLCDDGNNDACTQLRFVDRDRYYDMMGNNNSRNRRDRNSSRERNQDDDRNDRRQNTSRRTQESRGDDYINNVGTCNLVVDGLVVKPGKGTRFTFRESKVTFEESGEPVNLVYEGKGDQFLPLPPRS